MGSSLIATSHIAEHVKYAEDNASSKDTIHSTRPWPNVPVRGLTTTRHSPYLPDEIWEQILEELQIFGRQSLLPNTADDLQDWVQHTQLLAVLCRVNHQLRRLVQHVLWTEIIFRVYDWSHLLLLVLSVMQHPHLAQKVRVLRFCFGTPPNRKGHEKNEYHRSHSARAICSVCEGVKIAPLLKQKLCEAAYVLVEQEQLEAVISSWTLEASRGVDAAVTILAASCPSLEVLISPILEERNKSPSTVNTSESKILPSITLLTEFVYHCAISSFQLPLPEDWAVPLQHLRYLATWTYASVDATQYGRKESGTLAELCLLPALQCFWGTGFDLAGPFRYRPLPLVQGELAQHIPLCEQPQLRDNTCPQLRTLYLQDTSTSTRALAYILQLFPSLNDLSIEAREGGSCDLDFRTFGQYLQGSAIKALRHLELRGWRTEAFQDQTSGPITSDAHLSKLESLEVLEMPIAALRTQPISRPAGTQWVDNMTSSLPKSLRSLKLYAGDDSWYDNDTMDLQLRALMEAQEDFKDLATIELTNTYNLRAPWPLMNAPAPAGWHLQSRTLDPLTPAFTIVVQSKEFRRRELTLQ